MPIRNFPFSITSPADGIARPWIPIKIINPHSNKTVRFIGLIDTGADECAIPALFAPILEHDLDKGAPKTIGSAGGPTLGYSHTTKIEIYDFSDKLCYTINETPIDFMPNLNVVLLGVKQFLDQFELHINYPVKTFSIKYPAK